ncbi:DNA replication complex GINS family protein [Candidatus Bathyarchaeota archaeon]|nr:DNA replication complex GINS family protein [Candidatus Bathyarchaeota archaeon]MBS7631254.1 DNA replication complex GINS family protein [Candidatus Bathyarchaeota archaeon]
MSMKSPTDLNFKFENIPVKIIADKKIERLETAGITIDETEPNREIRVRLWLARELVASGLARFSNSMISAEELTQIHYRERFQPLGQLSPLPEEFYRKMYLTLSSLSMEPSTSTRAELVNRLKGMFRDVLESRIVKILRLASSNVTPSSKELQPEEQAIYNELAKLISSWRSQMKRMGVG